MRVRKAYTMLIVTNLAAAEPWYAKLIGRPPDNRPMDTLVQWEISDESGLGISTSEEISGRGLLFLIVDDIVAERHRLEGVGIHVGEDVEGDYSTLATVRDADGNRIILASPPTRPYPPA